jgi:hypothetical protein
MRLSPKDYSEIPESRARELLKSPKVENLDEVIAKLRKNP